MAVHTCSPSTGQVEKKKPEFQRHLPLHGKFEAKKDYMRYCLKKLKPKYNNKSNNNSNNNGDLFSRCLFPTIKRLSS